MSARRGSAHKKLAPLPDSLSSALKGLSVAELGMLFARQGKLPMVLEYLAELATEDPIDHDFVDHCRTVFEAGLLDLAAAAKSGDVTATARLAEIGDATNRIAASSQLPIGLVFEFLGLFARAGVEVPGEWAAQAERSLEEPLQSATPDGTLPDPNKVLEDLAELAEGDPFDLHEGLNRALAAFPHEHRSAVAGDLAGSGNAVAQAAAIGFLLDPDPRLGQAVLSKLTTRPPDSLISPLLVKRLAILKSWMPAEQGEAVDGAIAALQTGKSPPTAAANPTILSSIGTLCDGAGAQSFFLLIGDGDELTLVSVLVKIEAGVVDAWLSNPLTKREARTLLKSITAETMAVPISLDVFHARVRHGLSVNVKSGRPPPFRLLQVVERLGADRLEPFALAPSKVAGELLAKVPPGSLGPSATRAAHQAARSWPNRFPLTSTWFEIGRRVETICERNAHWQSRVAAVKTDILGTRRSFWAEQCAWSALVLAATNKRGWVQFALIARDLELGSDNVPLLELIARQTVARYAEVKAKYINDTHRVH